VCFTDQYHPVLPSSTHNLRQHWFQAVQKNEMLVVGDDPFFGIEQPVNNKVPIMVPYENLRHKQRPESANHNNWMQVSGEDRAEAWYP